MSCISRIRFTVVGILAALSLAFTSAQVNAKAPKMRDIADSINANVICTKFALMVQASDMGTFLSSRGPFTVFVPTDSAFSKLPPGVFETMLRPENKERLQIIVLFHVVNNKRLTAKDLLLLKTVPSCQGSPLTFKTSHMGTQYVMKAKITHSEIRCQNGLINEIDSLLMPPDSVLPPIAAPPSPAAQAPATNSTTTINEEVSPTTPSTNAADTNAPPVVPIAPVAH